MIDNVEKTKRAFRYIKIIFGDLIFFTSQKYYAIFEI